MTNGAAAINYVTDVTFTLQGAGNDDSNNSPTAVGTAVTFELNECEVTLDDNLREHAQGQADFSWMRGGGQRGQMCRFRRNLEVNDAVAAILAANSVLIFSITGTKLGEPFNIANAVGRRDGRTGTLAAPGTMEFTIRGMGKDWNGA